MSKLLASLALCFLCFAHGTVLPRRPEYGFNVAARAFSKNDVSGEYTRFLFSELILNDEKVGTCPSRVEHMSNGIANGSAVRLSYDSIIQDGNACEGGDGVDIFSSKDLSSDEINTKLKHVLRNSFLANIFDYIFAQDTNFFVGVDTVRRKCGNFVLPAGTTIVFIRENKPIDIGIETLPASKKYMIIATEAVGCLYSASTSSFVDSAPLTPIPSPQMVLPIDPREHSMSASPVLSTNPLASSSIAPSLSSLPAQSTAATITPTVSASTTPTPSSQPSTSAILLASATASVSSEPSTSTTPSLSVTPSQTRSALPTTSATPSASVLPSKSASPAPSVTPSGSLSPSGSATASISTIPSSSVTPSSSVIPSSSAVPSSSAAPSSSATPSRSATPSSSAKPLSSAAPSTSATPSTSAAASSSAKPSISATPSTSTAASSSISPSNNPTLASSPSSSSSVSGQIGDSPSQSATQSPLASPSNSRSVEPSSAPLTTPATIPTIPTTAPTEESPAATLPTPSSSTIGPPSATPSGSKNRTPTETSSASTSTLVTVSPPAGASPAASSSVQPSLSGAPSSAVSQESIPSPSFTTNQANSPVVSTSPSISASGTPEASRAPIATPNEAATSVAAQPSFTPLILESESPSQTLTSGDGTRDFGGIIPTVTSVGPQQQETSTPEADSLDTIITGTAGGSKPDIQSTPEIEESKPSAVAITIGNPDSGSNVGNVEESPEVDALLEESLNPSPTPTRVDIFGDDRPSGSPATPTPDPASVCFPGHATIRLADGSNRTMSQLSIGDRVHIGKSDHSDIFTFSHSKADTTFDFVKINTSVGSLMLTGSHYLYVNGKLAAAETVKAGDEVQNEKHEPVLVESVGTERAQGLYNPHTVHGDIIVNGFRTSCYTTAVDSRLAHMLLTPFRLMHQYGAPNSVLSKILSGERNSILSRFVPKGALVVE
eukprot:Plantae.Rhodophyta-Hildenbrandia_rubra.ctg9078.p1 GENE.Plantae.Rhodophyta-Hildenbrandia_rubra.ctg9078~~Plantae.Rhodophyta-Hildenbrandia_rubra.ctg9078.p1  ORF type:complete len:950 (+),score=133.85 Plantae.Rhodophyta-Hildenbrandia_rubra.ctg9078:1042-3891(+)